jgi:hypothetical protein
MTRTRRTLLGGAAALTLIGLAAPAAIATTAAHHPQHRSPVGVRILTPTPGSDAGTGGKGWMVDLVAVYPSLKASGFTGPQLTGPGVHADAAPFPGAFSTGADDRLPGLVVLGSTTTSTVRGFTGPGTNLANLFNLTALVDQQKHFVALQDSWIVGAPILGSDTDTTLTVAIIKDRNHDGIYNDAPATIPDADHDGRITASDVRAFGVAGSVRTVRFHLAGD